jgi:hypothetical protein
MTDDEHYTLYHGTSEESAKHLLKHGWEPNKWQKGSHQGQSKYLYLTNHHENAQWYADEKDQPAVLKIKVPKAHLKVDPEDGVHDTVEDELSPEREVPGNVVAHKPIPAHHIERFSLNKLKENFMDPYIDVVANVVNNDPSKVADLVADILAGKAKDFVQARANQVAKEKEQDQANPEPEGEKSGEEAE